MTIPAPLKHRLEKAHPAAVAVFAALAAFCTYSCMYAYRKPFTAATFSNYSFAGIKMKILLLIAWLVGYTLSKFFGIRFISGMKPNNRALYILGMIGFAELMLVFFAAIPPPFNIIFMLLNAVPLGMVWGLVFSYVEGRRATEFIGSVLAISLIFASGFVRSVATVIMDRGVSEFWMPAVTGAVFLIPTLIFVFLLEQVPAPSAADKASRTERLPMTPKERREFVLHYLPGLVVLVLTYITLSVIREFRDNFSADIWTELGLKDYKIFTQTETYISVIVLVIMSLLIVIRNNYRALQVNHLLVIAGFILAGTSTYAYTHGYITAKLWMILNGLGLYLGYVPFNIVFFERLIAAARKPANVGFLIYIADSFGYLGNIGVLLFKNFGQSNMSYHQFLMNALYAVSVIGGILTCISLAYFSRKIRKEHHE